MKNLNEIDHTQQTVTLGTEDNPVVSLMRGHVIARGFVKAFSNEGWGDDMTEEEIIEEAKKDKKDIKHTWGVFDSTANDGNGGWTYDVAKDTDGAEPITMRLW
jgi:hypothetical protein